MLVSCYNVQLYTLGFTYTAGIPKPYVAHARGCWVHAGADINAVLRDMGRVLEYRSSSSKQAAAGGDQARSREHGLPGAAIADTVRRLLSFACKLGWCAVCELLLPIAAGMASTASELVAELEALADEGLTLLHHAVRSSNVSVVSIPSTCCSGHSSQ